MIDTSTYSVRKLYDVIDSYFTENTDNSLLISVISFGYKRGIPLDADLVFDMRFIPNPFYIENLKHFSGLTPEVRQFVFSYERWGPICREDRGYGKLHRTIFSGTG